MIQRLSLNTLFVVIGSFGIGLYPLAGYQLDGFGVAGLTGDRVLILLSAVLLFFLIVIRGKIPSWPAFLIMFFLMGSVIISLALGEHGEFGSRARIFVICGVVFWLSAVIMGEGIAARNWLWKGVFFQGIIIIGFTVWTLYVIAAEGRFPLSLPMLSSLEGIISSRGGHVIEHGGFRMGYIYRMSLPFGRPQDLGLAASICFFLTVLGRGRFFKDGGWVNGFLVFLMLTVFLTGSRSAIFPFLAAFVVMLVLRGFGFALARKSFSPSLGSSLRIAGVSVGFCVLAAFLWQPVTSRIQASSVGLHLDIRKDAVEIFSGSNITGLLFGQEVDSYSVISGVSSAHMTFLTVLIEMGFLGLLVVFLPVLLICFYQVKHWRKISWDERSAVIAIIVLWVTANAAYEFGTMVGQWVMLGAAVGVSCCNSYHSRLSISGS